jgi:hypothetical protein
MTSHLKRNVGISYGSILVFDDVWIAMQPVSSKSTSSFSVSFLQLGYGVEEGQSLRSDMNIVSGGR